MTSIPRNPAEAIAILRDHAETCRHTQTVLRLVADWVASSSIYDPVEDRYAVRLPGDVVRRIRALADL